MLLRIISFVIECYLPTYQVPNYLVKETPNYKKYQQDEKENDEARDTHSLTGIFSLVRYFTLLEIIFSVYKI